MKRLICALLSMTMMSGCLMSGRYVKGVNPSMLVSNSYNKKKVLVVMPDYFVYQINSGGVITYEKDIENKAEEIMLSSHMKEFQAKYDLDAKFLDFDGLSSAQKEDINSQIKLARPILHSLKNNVIPKADFNFNIGSFAYLNEDYDYALFTYVVNPIQTPEYKAEVLAAAIVGALVGAATSSALGGDSYQNAAVGASVGASVATYGLTATGYPEANFLLVDAKSGKSLWYGMYAGNGFSNYSTEDDIKTLSGKIASSFPVKEKKQ